MKYSVAVVFLLCAAFLVQSEGQDAKNAALEKTLEDVNLQ